MRKIWIHWVLLLALCFNIAHDAIIVTQEQHIQENLYEYILEQTQGSDCGHAGESHYLFHFSAILASCHLDFTSHLASQPIVFSITLTPLFLPQSPIKPPIT